MQLDYITLRIAVKELLPVVKDSQVREITAFKERSVAMTLWCGEEIPIVISADPSNSRIHMLDSMPSKAENPDTHFHRTLRHHLAGAIIDNFQLVEGERIVEFILSRRELSGEVKRYRLIAELMGRSSNLILTDQDGLIIISDRTQVPRQGKGREIRPGKPYARPFDQDKIPLEIYPLDDFSRFLHSTDEKESWSKAFMKHFAGICPAFNSYISEKSQLAEELDTGTLDESQVENLHSAYSDAVSRMNEYKLFPPFDEILKVDPKSKFGVNVALARFYRDLLGTDLIEKRKNQWKQALGARVKSVRRLITNLEDDLAKAVDAEKFRKIGDLIYANLYLFKPGVTELELDDIFEQDTSEKIKIKLLDGKDAKSSAEEYHRRASKMTRSRKEIDKRLGEAKSRLLEYEALLEPSDEILQLKNAEFEKAVEDIKSGKTPRYIRKKGSDKKDGGSKGSKLPKKLQGENIHHYVSPEGHDIYVGGNDNANEALYRWGHPDDYWMHVKNIPGSHVLIPRRGEAIEYDTILFAARIAIYHSKVKGATKVPVDYTFIKFVKKPPGSAVGYVTYSKEKNVVADSLDERGVKKWKVGG
jgi:predicted ribosome quality control (RQC) complex YloA/Tae2 family protein